MMWQSLLLLIVLRVRKFPYFLVCAIYAMVMMELGILAILTMVDSVSPLPSCLPQRVAKRRRLSMICVNMLISVISSATLTLITDIKA